MVSGALDATALGPESRLVSQGGSGASGHQMFEAAKI